MQPEFNTFCKGILYLGKDVLIRNQTDPLQDVLLFGVATTRIRHFTGVVPREQHLFLLQFGFFRKQMVRAEQTILCKKEELL